MFPRCDAEREIAQNRLIGSIAEADVLEHHLTQTSIVQGAGAGVLNDFQRLLEQFADPFNGGETALNLRESLSQLPQWIKQSLGIKDERGEQTKAHGPTGHHVATQGQHQSDSPQGDPLQKSRNAAVEKDCAVDGPSVGRTCPGKTGAVQGLTPEHLHHLQTLEVLLKVGVELRKLFTHGVIDLAVATLQPQHHGGDGNLGEQQQQTQAPLDQQH